MEFFIDGHNLIPKVSGIRLSDENDEQELLDRIQEFTRISRKKCTVFFDKDPERKTHETHYGTLRVVHVTHLTKADEEIISRVNRAGKNGAREITVVSSDQHVQWQCHLAGAKTMTSESFAAEMNRTFSGSDRQNGPARRTGERIEPKLSKREVDEWLEIFNIK